MNPQVLDLLRQIVHLAPQFGLAAAGYLRVLPALVQGTAAFAQSVRAFVAAQGGWQAILQTLARSNLGQTLATAYQSLAGPLAAAYQSLAGAAGRVGRFVAAGAAGQFSRPGGVIAGAFGVVQSFGLAAGAAGSFAASAAAAALGAVGSAVSAAAAALASPLGVVAVVTVGVAAALTGLGVVTEKLGRTFLETQRGLAQSSAEMAVVFAQSDVRRVFREMRAGNEQAGTAGFLARRLDSLADALQPILSLLANIANVVGGIVVWIADMIVTPISLMAKAVTAIYEWLKKRFGLGDDSNDPNLLSQWLDNVAEDARRDRQQNAPFRGVQFR